MPVTELGAAALSAGVGALGSIGGSVAGGLFSANQAKKNRAFQERMYNKQVEDTLNFWNLQNEYNLPSAQLQRLKDAGLNPMLMYGQGGVQNVSTGSPDLPSAPHGAQGAPGSFNTPIELANLALVREQANLLRTEAEKNQQDIKESEAREENTYTDILTKRLSRQVDLAIKHGTLSEIFAATDNLRQQTYSTGQLTLQSVLSMMQARHYEIKRFNLDAETIGEQLQQRWKEIANGTISANAQMKSAFAAVLNAKANWKLSNAQVGQIALNMSQSREMFPLLKENQLNLNWSQVQNRIFRGVEIDNARKDGFMKELENKLQYSGFGKDTWLYKFAAPWVLPAIRDGKTSSSDIKY